MPPFQSCLYLFSSYTLDHTYMLMPRSAHSRRQPFDQNPCTLPSSRLLTESLAQYFPVTCDTNRISRQHLKPLTKRSQARSKWTHPTNISQSHPERHPRPLLRRLWRLADLMSHLRRHPHRTARVDAQARVIARQHGRESINAGFAYAVAAAGTDEAGGLFS